MPEYKFEMWDEVKDKVSGFRGIVLGRAEYSTGCLHYFVAPKALDKNNAILNWENLDESRLVLVKRAKEEAEPKKRRGGPLPGKMRYPTEK